MPRARYTADGGHYRIGGYGFDPGDEVDVGADLAEYLRDHDDFEVVDSTAPESADTGADSDGESGDDSDGGLDESTDADGPDAFDAGAFLDRTPVEDVAADIRAGEADGHLDAVAEAAERVTVQDAVGERRAELEG
jgi:hypothetical protein